MRSIHPVLLALSALVVALASPKAAHATAIKDITRWQGHGETTLWGLGFVVGLQGTGDSGAVGPLARSLAKLLESGGMPVPNLDDLSKSKNIALVMVTCRVPESGARRGEMIDVSVQAWHNAQSLVGGQLFITPLVGPIRSADPVVYAFADGPIVIEGDVLTNGRVREAARVATDILLPIVSPTGTVTLVLDGGRANHSMTSLIAQSINQERKGIDDAASDIALALDDRSVLVRIPDGSLEDPASFIAGVEEIQIDPSLFELPATVIVNERTGTIVVSGDVEISPVLVSHKDLTVTTFTPPPVPTPERPKADRSRWVPVDTVSTQRGKARLDDLLNALKQMDVPVKDQIAILSKLNATGRLHARFIVE